MANLDLGASSLVRQRVKVMPGSGRMITNYQSRKDQELWREELRHDQPFPLHGLMRPWAS